jgi:sulfate permease, SulP family
MEDLCAYDSFGPIYAAVLSLWRGTLAEFSSPRPTALEYRSSRLLGDIVAGITLAAYAIPVSLAYSRLAGPPPQVGIYGHLLGGPGYARPGS